MQQSREPLRKPHNGTCNATSTTCKGGASCDQHRVTTDDHAQHVAVTFLVLQQRNATLAVDPVVSLLQPQAITDREPHRRKVRWQLDGFAAV